MRLSAAIMAHPDRGPLVDELIATLDRPVPVVWDDRGPPSGHGDRVWRTARTAWKALDPTADWHVILQDDALVCADFLAGLEVGVASLPGPAVVSAYLGQGRNVPTRWKRMATRADEQRASWIRSYLLMWGVAVAAPVALIPEMIAWCDRKAGMPDDMRVGRWFQRQHIDAWYTWPSLADHRPVPSLTKHRAADRRAARHHPGSALELDWSGPTVIDPMIVRSRGPRSAPTAARRLAGA